MAWTAAARLLLMATLSRGGDATAFCHGDVLIKGLDFTQLTEAAKSTLGPDLAETIAFQNGISQSDVLTPAHAPGRVGFFAGSYVAPWSPPNRRPYTQGSSTIVSCVISGCNLPKGVLGAFKNPDMHKAIVDTITGTLGNSGAVQPDIQVLGVAVVPETTPPSTPTPPLPHPAATAVPSGIPLTTGAPPVALPGSAAGPASGQPSGLPGWWPAAGAGACVLLLACGLFACVRRSQSRHAREGFRDVDSEESDLGH
mmetsp:Transcript_54704/g.123104  ORF Transcript_54704/g.123104 Transcript_54704/m.123104 type:complete len:255 (-) Transcript_54704:78-842(-)